MAPAQYKTLREENSFDFEIIPMEFSNGTRSDCGQTIIHACRYSKNDYLTDDEKDVKKCDKYDSHQIFVVSAPNIP